MPVGRRDDCLARAQGVSKRPRNDLRFVTVRGYVNVCSPDKFHHLLGTDEAIVEEHTGLHSYFFRQSLQVLSILVSLTPKDMWVGRARDDVNDVLVL